jgi:hypothetical protein
MVSFKTCNIQGDLLVGEVSIKEYSMKKDSNYWFAKWKRCERNYNRLRPYRMLPYSKGSNRRWNKKYRWSEKGDFCERMYIDAAPCEYARAQIMKLMKVF